MNEAMDALDAAVERYKALDAAWKKTVDEDDAQSFAAHSVLVEAKEALVREAVRFCEKRREVPRVPELSPRETEVVRLLAMGVSTKEVGRELGISSKTVETHRVRIYAKTRTHSAVGLTLFAIRVGLIQANGTGASANGGANGMDMSGAMR